MKNASTYEIINYFLRVVGRIGFCILLLAIYKVYHLFASPLVKKRHKTFIRFYIVSMVLGFVLLGLNFIVPDDLITTVAMAFNTLTTYIIGGYLYYQGNVLEGYRTSDEFKNLTGAMDAMILKMKHT